MLDTAYLTKILQDFQGAGYGGIQASTLWEKYIPSNSNEDRERLKFVYHMDEIWSSGLIRWQDNVKIERWGFSVEGRDEFTLIPCELVLTPAGSALIEELSKDKGFHRFRNLVKSVGMKSGSSALSAVINEYVTKGM